MTYGVLVISDVPLDVYEADGGNIDVPPVEVVTLRQGVHNARVDGVAVHELNLGEPDALLEAGRGPDPGNHHELDELLAFYRQFPPLGFFQSIFGGGDALVCEGFEELYTGDAER